MTGPWISGVQVADPRVAATSRVKQYQLRIVDRSSDIPPGIQATPAPNRCYWPKWFSSGAGCTGGRIRARVRQAAPDIGGGEGARRAAQMGGDRRGSFHESCLCGANPNARHTRDTVVCDIPRCVAIDRVDQCVASGGVVSSVAVINASICASSTTRGRPGRGSSSKPSQRASRNRLRHLVIVPRSTPSRAAKSVFEPPSAAANTISARSAKPAALVRRRAPPSNSAPPSHCPTPPRQQPPQSLPAALTPPHSYAAEPSPPTPTAHRLITQSAPPTDPASPYTILTTDGELTTHATSGCPAGRLSRRCTARPRRPLSSSRSQCPW